MPADTGLLARLARTALVEQLRASLWFIPTVAVTTACVAAGLLNRIEVGDGSWLSRLVFPGGPESARGILQTIAGSVITVTGVVFSLTVVTLQLASTQFSPRLLRTFLRDVSNQVVLGTFLATFAYCVVVLRGVQSATDTQPARVPDVAVTGAYLLIVASVIALVYFIDHIARAIRIDSLMREVNEDTSAVIRHLSATRHPNPSTAVSGLDGGAPIAARRSGFVQAVDEARLLRHATGSDCAVRVETMVGDRVIEGAPVAWVHPAPPSGEVPGSLADAVTASVQVGYERTMQQDVAFGLRQLVDVAVKALSPGVNDPTTAVHAVAHLAHLLVRLAQMETGNRVTCDDDGNVRVVVPGRGFSGFLGLACDQIRRYGAAEPAVTTELLRLVLDVARADHRGRHRDAICHQTDLIVAAAEAHTAEPRDLDPLYELRDSIHETVAGRSA